MYFTLTRGRLLGFFLWKPNTGLRTKSSSCRHSVSILELGLVAEWLRVKALSGWESALQDYTLILDGQSRKLYDVWATGDGTPPWSSIYISRTWFLSWFALHPSWLGSKRVALLPNWRKSRRGIAFMLKDRCKKLQMTRCQKLMTKKILSLPSARWCQQKSGGRLRRSPFSECQSASNARALTLEWLKASLDRSRNLQKACLSRCCIRTCVDVSDCCSHEQCLISDLHQKLVIEWSEFCSRDCADLISESLSVHSAHQYMIGPVPSLQWILVSGCRFISKVFVWFCSCDVSFLCTCWNLIENFHFSGAWDLVMSEQHFKFELCIAGLNIEHSESLPFKDSISRNGCWFGCIIQSSHAVARASTNSRDGLWEQEGAHLRIICIYMPLSTKWWETFH